MLKTDKRQKKSGKTGLLLIYMLTGVAVITLFALKDKIKSSFDPISIAAKVNAAELKETDGRTNILILGSDKRTTGSEHSNLTDTILVASIGRVDKDVVLISLPRDLWVQLPNGGFSKINSAYAYGGVDYTKKAVENTLGITIQYHVLVTFELFQEAINTLGGVEVNVDQAFTDYEYPVENMEKNNCGRTSEEILKMQEEGKSLLYIFPCRYEKIQFAQGQQTMEGETVLKFVRSRHGDNNEGTDFARAKRQQKVITAVKNKALSIQTIINPLKLKELYDLYEKNVDTDIDFGTVQNFYLLSQQISFDKVVSIVLDDRSAPDEGGLLYSPQDTSLYGGQYVLVPKTGDFSQIHAYVQRYIFGNK